MNKPDYIRGQEAMLTKVLTKMEGYARRLDDAARWNGPDSEQGKFFVSAALESRSIADDLGELSPTYLAQAQLSDPAPQGGEAPSE